MARYEHLPVYRSAMKLAVHLENTVRTFPRYVKYTLGSEMRHEAQRIISLVIRANNERDRLETLRELRGGIELLLAQARICQESNGFRSFASFAATVELAGQVARQTEGWLKASGARAAPEPSAGGRAVVPLCAFSAEPPPQSSPSTGREPFFPPLTGGLRGDEEGYGIPGQSAVPGRDWRTKIEK